MIAGKPTTIEKVIKVMTKHAMTIVGREAEYEEIYQKIDVYLAYDLSVYRINPDAFIKTGDISTQFEDEQKLHDQFIIGGKKYELVDFKSDYNPITYSYIYKGILRPVI